MYKNKDSQENSDKVFLVPVVMLTHNPLVFIKCSEIFCWRVLNVNNFFYCLLLDPTYRDA